MKIAIGIALFVWLLCGLIGASMLRDDAGLQWKAVARGPITLVKAFTETEPVKYPGT